MRMIGQLPAEPDARRFVDYLLTQSIAAHAEESANGSWLIWVEHDDQLDPAKAELAGFAANPSDPKFDSAANAAQIRRQEAKAAERRQKNYRDVRTTMFTAPSGATPVTMLIIGLSVVAYVVTHFGAPELRFKVFNWMFFVSRAVEDSDAFGSRGTMFVDIFKGQVWRLVTPVFLHGGMLHILFNMLWMVDLGRRIEPNVGTARFIGLFLVIAILSCTAQAGWYAVATPLYPDHYRQFLGMSGVVSGLFGYAWVCGRLRPYERIGVSGQETGYMIGWLVICSFGLIGSIANVAHWGGLIVGGVLGAIPSIWKRR
jgi:GlpG protein